MAKSILKLEAEVLDELILQIRDMVIRVSYPTDSVIIESSGVSVWRTIDLLHREQFQVVDSSGLNGAFLNDQRIRKISKKRDRACLTGSDPILITMQTPASHLASPRDSALLVRYDSESLVTKGGGP